MKINDRTRKDGVARHMTDGCISCGGIHFPMVQLYTEEGIGAMCLKCLVEKCSDAIKEKGRRTFIEAVNYEMFTMISSKFKDAFKNIDYSEFKEKTWEELEPKVQRALLEAFGLG